MYNPQIHPRSLHLASLASRFQSSVACAAAPAVTPASERICEFSSDVSDMSQAAVLPVGDENIHRMRTTVIRIEVATSFHFNTKMGSPTCFSQYIPQLVVAKCHISPTLTCSGMMSKKVQRLI